MTPDDNPQAWRLDAACAGLPTPHYDPWYPDAPRVTTGTVAHINQARRDQIKHTLREHLPTGTHKAGPYTITVRAGARRINPTKITAAFPFDAHPELYTVTVDLDQGKTHVAPADLEPFTTQAAASVTIR